MIWLDLAIDSKGCLSTDNGWTSGPNLSIISFSLAHHTSTLLLTSPADVVSVVLCVFVSLKKTSTLVTGAPK